MRKLVVNFQPCDVEVIQTIHIFSLDTTDTMVWSFTRNEKYIVKSGYYGTTKEARAQKECSNKSYSKNFWKKLWGINVPNKVKKIIVASFLECSAGESKLMVEENQGHPRMFC
ncbi:hypothetical protein U1Q18_052476 [Sarracenia purpurea var. burkii]